MTRNRIRTTTRASTTHANRATARSPVEGLENRLLFAAGDVDTAFGVNGFAGATFPGHTASASDVVVDAPRGRILVAGAVDGGDGRGGRLALAAFKFDGKPDTSFSGDGKAIVNDLPGAANLELLPDGRFYVRVVRRFADPAVPPEVTVARFKRDGSYDTAFSGDGKLTLSGGGGIAAAPAGKLVQVSGRFGPLTVTRYNANGSLDRTLGGDGSVTVAYAGGTGADPDAEWHAVEDVVVQPDGRIVIAGDVYGDDLTDGVVARLKADGSYDGTFSGDGRQVVVASSTDYATVVALAPGGDILVGVIEAEQNARVVRLAADGSVVPFADPGIASNLSQILDIGVAPDGKVVVSGRADWYGGAYPNVGFLYRLNPGGGLDPSFGGSGTTHVIYPIGWRQAIDPSGNILLLNGGFGVTRYRGAGGGDAGEGMKASDGTLTIAGTAGGDRIRISRANDATLVATVNGNTRSFPFASVRRIKVDAGGGNDNVSFDAALPTTVYGGAGDDHLEGGRGADRLLGGSGNDTLVGGDGPNALWGGAGDDLLVGGGWNYADYFRGEAGVDTVSYAGRVDPVTVTIDGVANDGEREGGSNEGDNVFTDVENVIGGDGDDHLTGSAANNTLDGGPGQDDLRGGGGDDTLIGGSGKDQLRGQAGNDTFYASGDSAVDFLDGGSGNDQAIKDRDDFAQYVERLLA